MQVREVRIARDSRHEQIAERLQSLADAGMRLKAEGAPVQYDVFVAQPVSFYQFEGPGTGAGMLVFAIDGNGQIEHEWVIDWLE